MMNSARVILRHENGSVLLIFNRKNMVWEFPGGKVEKNEHTISAAVRELQEETTIGIKRRNLHLLGSATYVGREQVEPHKASIFWAPKNVTWGWAQIPEDEPDIVNIMWTDRDKLKHLNMHPFSRFAESLLPF
jgi:8-oxo-dGTP pyrophosphatase MutT (NUDIX family)